MSTPPSSSTPLQHTLDTSRPRRRLLAGRISLQAAARFCHNVGTGLHAGIDARRVFENEASRGSMHHRAQVTQVRDLVAQGSSVAEALAHAGGYFPPLLCEMAEMGERTGKLEQVFLRMGEYYQRLLSLRRTFLIGIAWPMFELILAVFVIGMFILIVGLISDSPPMTFFGLTGPSGAAAYFGTVGLIVGAIAGAIFAATKGWVDLDPFYRLLMHVPFLGGGLKTMALSRLTWSLAMTTNSDLSAQRAVELAVRTTENSYYTRFIEGMKNVLGRGHSMYDAFCTTGVYPADFLDALQTGEIAGSISETMQILSQEYEDRTKAFCRMLTVVASVLVFLLVAGLLIFMIFSMALQYIGIINNAVEGKF